MYDDEGPSALNDDYDDDDMLSYIQSSSAFPSLISGVRHFG